MMNDTMAMRNRTVVNGAALPRAVLLSAVLGGVAAPGAALATPVADAEPAWVGAASVGHARGPRSLPLMIELGSPPMALTLNGQASLEGGSASSFTLARQFRGLSSDQGRRLHPVRLEIEDLRATLTRRGLSAGVLQVGLNDEWRLRGTFLNGLVRVGDFDSVQWWLGAGVGRLRADVPDASSALPGCGCLREGSGQAWVPRLKLRAEVPTTERSAFYLEAAQTRAPAVAAGAGSATVTHYEGYSLRTMTVGWRVRF